MPCRTLTALLVASVFILVCPCIVRAETGEAAWLRYAPLNETNRAKYDFLPADVVKLGDSAVLQSSQDEIIRGIKGMLGRTLRAEKSLPNENAIILGTIASVQAAAPEWRAPSGLRAGGFLLTTARIRGLDCIIVAGGDNNGVLYGSFALLRKIALGDDLKALNDREEPSAPLRWINQWDNINGTIERGYGGRSIFFDSGKVRDDLSRASEYARLLASLGINGCSVNNVNANISMLDEDFLPQLARIAAAFRPWGVRLALSVDVSSPQKLGGLATFDPLDPQVAEWWAIRVDQIYAQIPDFAGFVVKADSEGRPGPSSYGRTPADAANAIARALKPHGGVLFYRAFVYDHHLDPTNMKADRARAAYDIFHPLDGKFDDNVVVQIKARSHRFSGARTHLAAFRRPRKDQRSNRAANHTGIHGPAAAYGFSSADVERDARFRYARERRKDVGEGHHFRRNVS